MLPSSHTEFKTAFTRWKAKYPDASYREGVATRLCATRLATNSATAGLKTLNRLEQVLARSELHADDTFEGLTADADDNIVWVKGPARLYVEGNWTPRWPEGTSNGWDIGIRDIDDRPQYHPVDEGAFRAMKPFPTPHVRTTKMAQLYELVLTNAGSTRPRRDEVDRRIVAEVRARTGRVGMGSSHPTLQSATPPTDADRDGMPDAWERVKGLNPENPDDANGDLDGDGYTNVEDYLNELAGDPLPE